MKNKTNLLLGLGSLAIGIVPVASVVSCRKSDSINISEIKNTLLTLNDSGKNKTVDEFITEASYNLENALNLYTNWENVVSVLQKNNLVIKPVMAVKSNSLVEIKVAIGEESDRLILTGFKNAAGILQAGINNLQLSVNSSSQSKTAEDVCDEWKNSNDENKAWKLINNFDFGQGVSIAQGPNGKLIYNDLKNNATFTVTVLDVDWNRAVIDNSIKGNTISITFEFERESKVAQATKNIIGFSSYTQKFNNMFNLLKTSGIYAKPNPDLGGGVTSAAVMVSEITTASNNQEKVNALIRNTTINEIVRFNEGANIIVNSVSMGSNDTVLNLECSFEWREIRRDNISKTINGFSSKNDAVNLIIQSLSQVQLNPTEEGKRLSSDVVVQRLNENPTSIWRYIDKRGLPELGIDIKVKSATSNNNDNNVPVKKWGDTITLNASFTLEGQEYNVTFRPISGFRTLYSFAEEQFNAKVSEINFSLSPAASSIVPSMVNQNNWRNYVTNLPEEGNGYSISAVDFTGSDDASGTLVVSFTYNYNFHGEVIASLIGPKRFEGLSTNNGLTTKNFNNLREQMRKNNYLDTIIKNGESKSNFFTSYFGHDNKTIDGLRRLFDIPSLYGTSVTVNDIKYSRTDGSLGDTQLRVSLTLTNLETQEKFQNEWVVGGFMDPFGFGSQHHGTMRRYIDLGNEYKQWNNPDYDKFSSVPDRYKLNDFGTYQDNWIRWGYSAPFSYYVNKHDATKFWLDGWRNGDCDDTQYGSAKEKATAAITEDFRNMPFNLVSVRDFRIIYYYGAVTRGNLGSDGICRGDVTCSIEFSSNATDARGNRAVYNNKVINNVFLFIYLKNGWWK